jgi:hypothetical protein
MEIKLFVILLQMLSNLMHVQQPIINLLLWQVTGYKQILIYILSKRVYTITN